MKKYSSPEIMNINFETEDVITASSALILGDHHAGEISAKEMEIFWNDENTL